MKHPEATTDAPALIGLELNGIVDVAIVADVDGVQRSRRQWTGGTVVFPSLPRERPIAGEEAATSTDGLTGFDQSLTGRWWVRDGLDAVRLREWPTNVTSPRGGSYAISDLLGAHLRLLPSVPVERLVVTVPDVLADVGQQVLLDGLGHLRSSTELLWRPVAALLAWGAHRTVVDEDTPHFVVHVGPDVPEIGIYQVRLDRETGTPLIVPIRAGPGQLLGVPGLHQSLLPGWWKAVASSASVSVDDIRAAPTGWARIGGGEEPEAYVRSSGGAWSELPTTDQFDELEHYAEALADALRPVLKSHGSPDTRVLLEGATCYVRGRTGTVAEIIQRRLEETGAVTRVSALEVLPNDSSARGAAIYAWRRQHDLPTYEDVLPGLEIYALVNGRPEFVELVPANQRVRGGQPFVTPIPLTGFSVASGTEALDYYLARQGEATVRSTTTALRVVPTDAVPLELTVRQRPAQGLAEVEIFANPSHAGVWQRVALDWSTMEDTGESPDDLLERLTKEQGFAYPAIAPLEASTWVWRQVNVDVVMRRFLHVPMDSPSYEKVLTDLTRSMSQKGDPESIRMSQGHGSVRSHGVVSSEGRLPEDEWDRTRQEAREQRFQELLLRIAADFEAVVTTFPRNEGLRRRLMILGAWCYASTPTAILEFARGVIASYRHPRGPRIRHPNYAVNVAERAFVEREDLKNLFRSAIHEIGNGGLLKHYWLKASAAVLRYREAAPSVLDRSMATALAHVAIRTMRDELLGGNVAKRFFSGALLLVGLLRFRSVDAAFLTQDDPDTKEILQEAESVLDQARSQVAGNKREKVVALLESIKEYLEGRGQDALIFVKLEAGSEGEVD